MSEYNFLKGLQFSGTIDDMRKQYYGGTGKYKPVVASVSGSGIVVSAGDKSWIPDAAGQDEILQGLQVVVEPVQTFRQLLFPRSTPRRHQSPMRRRLHTTIPRSGISERGRWLRIASTLATSRALRLAPE